jgi:hypothetical protein
MYNGVIFYNNDETGTEVKVNRYVWKQNALILYFECIIEIIPYHAFTRASFDKIEKEDKNEKR